MDKNKSLFKNTTPAIIKADTEAGRIYEKCFDMLGACFIDEVYSFEHFHMHYSVNVLDSYLNLINCIKYETDSEVDRLIKDVKKLNKERNRKFTLEFITGDKYFEKAKKRWKAFDEGVWMTANIHDIDINKKSKIPVEINRSFDIDKITKVYKSAFLDAGSAYKNEKGNWRRVFQKSIIDKAGNYEVYNYIAEATNTAVGLITVITDKEIAYIGSIAVIPEFQGNGLAGELIAFTAKEMAKLGCRTFVLDTELNSQLQSIYQHLGFRKILETFCCIAD
jgi:ribosomal protein S18 acetylase RimI-like enzyme